jgi:hypothetical protein
LNYGEPRLNLPSQRHLSISLDRTAQATFTVDEADDPLLYSWPFLLIVRTGHFFTAQAAPPESGAVERVVPDTTEFPANSQLHSSPSLA